MLKYIINYSELNGILHLLFRLFNIRITFFDLVDYEPGYFDIKPLSAYCASKRKDMKFDSFCITCDRKHLALAKEQKEILLYTCHAGLFEAVVPLYNKNIYLGSIVFGQIRPPGKRPEAKETNLFKNLFKELPSHEKEYLFDLAQLLKHISEYIIIKEMVRYRKKDWVEKLNNYLGENLRNNLSLDDLTKHTGKSRSFVSHYFKKEFDASPLKYHTGLKLKLASERIKNGEIIRNVALDLGFYDEYHFSRVFKKVYGYPPSKLKNTARIP